MNDLILNVDALEEANQPFEADLSREFLDSVLRAPPPTEFYAAGAARLKGRATKMGREVLVQAKATVPLRGQCKRCLCSVNLEEQVEVTRTWVPRDNPPKETVDEDTYEGKEIDLSPAVREQVLLSVPASPLCREDCNGLCPACGKDLNEGDCGCDRTVIDPRWAALKGIQLKKEK